jgi:mRNA interferase MazF
MTTKGKQYPTRVVCKFQEKDGLIVLDQIRTVDKTRLVEYLGLIDENERGLVLATLAEMFAD